MITQGRSGGCNGRVEVYTVPLGTYIPCGSNVANGRSSRWVERTKVRVIRALGGNYHLNKGSSGGGLE